MKKVEEINGKDETNFVYKFPKISVNGKTEFRRKGFGEFPRTSRWSRNFTITSQPSDIIIQGNDQPYVLEHRWLREEIWKKNKKIKENYYFFLVTSVFKIKIAPRKIRAIPDSEILHPAVFYGGFYKLVLK
eukprot:GHVP01026132.1.p1 GENE.GHVP01026132.1~~GHVP01026132.1.p1  ORF type:complete len:131 (+),score=23.68 GHVP01026132.1:303-695(+)